MSRTFTFSNTAGTLNFTLAPGQTNSKYDVNVFGQGAQLWGEDVDRNFIRLLENFSAPQKQMNDYNPVTGNPNDYDPDTQSILPRDANDLGAETGINNPISGQLWFNTDTGSLYIFDYSVDNYSVIQVDTANDEFVIDGNHTERFLEEIDFEVRNSTANDGDYTVDAGGATYDSGNDQTLIPVTADLIDATADGGIFFSPEQVIFGWKRVTGSVFSSGTNGPTSPQQGDLWYDTSVPQLKIWDGSPPWTSVADRYLLLDGGTMTGQLDMGSNNIVAVAEPRLNKSQDAATKNYVDTLRTDLTSNGLLDPQYVNQIGDTMTGVLTLDETQGSYLTIPHSSSTLTVGQFGGVTSGSDIRKDSNMLVSAAGNLYMHFSSGNTFRIARGGADRSSGFTNLVSVASDGLVSVITGYETLSLTNNSLVNKKYVDDNSTSLLNELDDVNTTPSDGDVLTYNNSSNDWEAGARTEFAMPTGSIINYGTTTPPSGWLYCNGQAVSRTTYANLFSAIGTLYGNGDGSTTFNIPDLRGEFVRGWDDGRGVDTGRSFSSVQAGQVQRHKHVGGWGEHKSQYAYFGHTNNRGYRGSYGNDWDNFLLHTNDGTNYDGTVNATGVIGDETRPRNIALIYIIKT